MSYHKTTSVQPLLAPLRKEIEHHQHLEALAVPILWPFPLTSTSLLPMTCIGIARVQHAA